MSEADDTWWYAQVERLRSEPSRVKALSAAMSIRTRLFAMGAGRNPVAVSAVNQLLSELTRKGRRT